MEAKSNKIVKFLKNDNAVIILLLLVILSSIVADGMINQFDTVLVESSIYGVIAMGLAIVMVTGNIDLSVGFQAATAAVVTILVYNLTNGSLLISALAAILVGALMGAFNGLAVVKFGISPLIATIATNYIFKGIVYFFTRDGAIYPDGELRNQLKGALASNQLFGVKALTLTVILFVLLLAVGYFLMKRTRGGVSLYISGDNAEAGQLAGINIARVNWIAYVLCGICCAVGGIFLASKSGSAIYSQGEGRDVFAISACVIGGIKMAGGKGTMVNVLLGVLIMRIISTGMNQMLIPAAWVDFVSGALLVIILIIDRFTSEKEDG